MSNAELIAELKTIRAYSNIVDSVIIDRAIAALSQQAATEQAYPYIFWAAYHRGHHDTVDGDYIDVVQSDCNSYWKDEARIAAGEYAEQFGADIQRTHSVLDSPEYHIGFEAGKGAQQALQDLATQAQELDMGYGAQQAEPVAWMVTFAGKFAEAFDDIVDVDAHMKRMIEKYGEDDRRQIVPLYASPQPAPELESLRAQVAAGDRLLAVVTEYYDHAECEIVGLDSAVGRAIAAYSASKTAPTED